MKRPVFLFLFLSSTVAFAAPNPQFQQWDKDKDGKLSPEELPPGPRQNFGKVDLDQDGFISEKEDADFRNRGKNGNTEIEVLTDIDYAGTGNERQTLDLYLPPSASKPVPLIVFIHGGGWQGGSKEAGRRRLLPFVRSNQYAAASIGYRLTDEAQWPSQIHDCRAGLRWLRANAEKHNVDASRIAVWGTSAGGHLVAMLGTSHDVEGLEGKIGPHTDQSSEVQAVVNFFGPANLGTMGDFPSKIDHNAPDSPESKLIGGALPANPEKAANASPQTHVTDDDVPSLIVHGTEDELVPYDQSVQFEKALEAAGVPTIFLTVDGAGHGNGFGPEVDKAVADFLGNQLLGEKRELEDATVPARKR